MAFDFPSITSHTNRLGEGVESLGQQVGRLEAEAERLVKARLVKLSGGPYSAAALRAMGHPYSRRRPHPPAAPYIVNVQSGQFRRSWRVKARMQGGDLEIIVDNTAPYARYLFDGTSRMIARPIRERVAAEVREWLGRWLSGRLAAAAGGR